MDEAVTLQLDLPAEALAEEQKAAGAQYQLGDSTPLAPDPDAVEAHFIDPISIIAVVSVVYLANRILTHFLVKDGKGTLVDARTNPPTVSRLADVPEGYILLIKPDGSTQAIDAGKIEDDALADILKPILSSGKA